MIEKEKMGREKERERMGREREREWERERNTTMTPI